MMLRQSLFSFVLVAGGFVSGWVIDDVDTMSRGRFEGLQLITRLGLPVFVVVLVTWLARLVAPVRLGPRFEGECVMVPRHTMLPLMRKIPLERIVEVRRAPQGVQLVHPGGRKTFVMTKYLDGGDGFWAEAERRVSAQRS